jgi:hypothetical protein
MTATDTASAPGAEQFHHHNQSSERTKMSITDEMRKAKRARLVALFGADTGNGIADIHERRALEDAVGVFPDIVVVESVEPPDGYAGPDFSMALDEEGNIDVDAALDILRAHQSARSGTR